MTELARSTAAVKPARPEPIITVLSHPRAEDYLLKVLSSFLL